MRTAYKYKALESTARTWDEIELFYKDLIFHQWPLNDILPLIQFIRNNQDLSQRLFGCTSLDRLIVSIYSPIELQKEVLWIQFNKEKGLWNFKYYPIRIMSPNTKAITRESYLLKKFLGFIDLLRWR